MAGRCLILAEKPSAARNFARALGGMRGTYEGQDFEICSLAGHLLEFCEPHEMVEDEQLRETLVRWDVDELPWDWRRLSWRKRYRGDGARPIARRLVDACARVDEVCIATDVDPTGEGELLAWEALDHVGWHGKTTRMRHEDESQKSVRAAFTTRQPLTTMEEDGEWRMADARSRYDFLSMQLTRAATCVAREKGHDLLLRQGRLKSVIVALVGDAQRARAEYVKVPFFEARFADENGNVFSREDADRHATKAEVDLSRLHESGVTPDGTKTCHKPPPALPDLAALSATLAERGYGAAEVLETYQRMYEAGLLSYPRTEDRFVSEEQFAVLLPLTDAIAAAVGVDTALLTHREARKTHVRSGGAHGANRPGTTVPESREYLTSYGRCAGELYELVARAWLATLAPDYCYTRHEAHVTDFPEYRARTNVPEHMGWRDVVGASGQLDAVPEAPFGKLATPFVHEGSNKRPPRPSARWLSRQLERYDVGTGATRTSVLADCEAGGASALIADCRGELSLTDCGKVSHTLIRGCEIASPDVTERLLAKMRDIRDGKATADELLDGMAPMVTHDLSVMRANADGLDDAGPTELGPCPRCGGSVVRRASGSVSCASNRYEREAGDWRLSAGCGYSMGKGLVHGRPLTDRQLAALLSGKAVLVTRKSAKTGRTYRLRVTADPEGRYGIASEFASASRGSRKGRHTRGGGRP